MSNDAPEKMKLTSMDMAEEKRARLKRLFPEVFTEDRIDFEQLRRVLGDWVEPGKERYGLNWPGKAECMKIIQAPSIATLKPARDESVDFDTTENLFIEGDNLEVLKLLQKAYFGKVKMIYIDPPYNTGKEFIYPDKYQDNLDTYLAYTGQVDDEGKRFATNTDAGGRFHANWLNMMYLRLYLARNLLREDGVIFISIDDNESANLKALCNAVFGAANHLVTFYIQVRYQGKTLAEKNDYQKLIEQVHVYQKFAHQPIKEKEEYSLKEFCWRIDELSSGRTVKLGGRDVEIFMPDQYKIYKVPSSIDNLKETWASGSVLKVNASGKYFKNYLAPRKGEDGVGVLYKVAGIGEDGIGYRYFTGPKKESATKGKFYSGVPTVRRKEIEEGVALKPKPILNFYDFADGFGNCRHEGGVDFRSGKKPVKFLKKLISQATENDDSIVLDFFAGSASLAHAVIEKNVEDKGKRRFIMVQLPEEIDDGDKSSSYPFDNIADIGKERIRIVGKKIIEENQSQLDLEDKTGLDFGFKVFKLSRSNFSIWDGDAEKTQDLVRQLELHVNHIDSASGPEDILYELLLKAGFELTTRIERRTMAGKDVYAVDDGALLVCLDKAITPELIDALADADPLQVICLDEGFKGNDQLKTNAVQTFKAHAASRETEIVFQTV